MKKLAISPQLILLVLFSYTIIGAQSCCENQDDWPTYYMDQEFKDYVVFPVGSYWVYEDSASGKTDSVSLVSQSINLFDNDDSDGQFKFEGLNQKFTSIDSSTDDLNRIGGIDELRNSYNYFEENEILFFSKKPVGSMSLSNMRLIYEKYLDSLTVINKTFKLIKVFYNPDSFINSNKRIFHAHQIGIIRRETTKKEVWNLKKYHINK